MVREWSAKPRYSGSNPLVASKFYFAGVAELVDARDLKSLGVFPLRAGSIPASGISFVIIKKKNEYIFLFALISTVINISFFWNSIPPSEGKSILISLYFVFSLYFLIYHLIYTFLSAIYYKLPFFLFFLYFFLIFSHFPENFPHNFIYISTIIIFSLAVLGTPLFENFFSFKLSKNFYPVLFFSIFLSIYALKIIESNASKIISFSIGIFLFLFISFLIFISKYIKFPSFLYPSGLTIFLIFFFISFFYFFPFNPIPYEKKGQNFIFITIEGFRSDSLSSMPNIRNIKEKGVYFSSFYIPSPDFTFNLKKLFSQKEKALLDFFPSRYESLALIPLELKNFDLLKNFKKKSFFEEKDFYSESFKNLFFFKFLNKSNKLEYEEILKSSINALENTNKPFFLWLHISNLKFSISDKEKNQALNGTLTDINILKEKYFKEVSKVDSFFGKLLNKIGSKKWFDKTNIFILGVSGYEIMEHQKLGPGTGYYQESIQVPFLWIGPGLPQKKILLPVSLLDIFPTVIKKFNLSDNYKSFEGIEFLSVFENIFPFERVFSFKENKLFIKGNAFLKENIKVIKYNNGKVEIYNLKKDPEERENLFFSKDMSAMKFFEEVKNL